MTSRFLSCRPFPRLHFERAVDLFVLRRSLEVEEQMS
jgi:hypothetical protein